MRFRIIVHGRIATERVPPRGLFTTRTVDAPSTTSASEKAVALVRDDPRVAEFMADCTDLQVHFDVDEMVELSQSDDSDPEPQSFIFYDEAVAPNRAS